MNVCTKEQKITSGRAGAITILWKDSDAKDITREYFDRLDLANEVGRPSPRHAP